LLISAQDHELARDLAAAAGQRLLALRSEDPGVDPASLRKAGDLSSHEFICAELARLRPDDAVLSEEGKDNPARLTADRVWIVDPLDGTREYGEPGRSDWAVHIALWAGGDLAAGAVALPAQGKVLSTAEPVPHTHGGTTPLDPTAARAAPARPLRVLVSRTRPPEFVKAMANRLGAVLVPMGSAGAKAAAVITGEADVYVHAGGQYEWDSAAPVAVAQAAGLHASRIDGSPLRYNQADPFVPDILISPAAIAPRLLEVIARLPAMSGAPAHVNPSAHSDQELH
jgi:3'(2'), 5'-bisphosphate nucleotidase